MEFIVALKDSLKMFLHWELYVAAIAFILLNALFDIFPKKKDKSIIHYNQETQPKGYVVKLIEALIHVLTTASFVIILSPLILNVSDSADWLYPIKIVLDNYYIIIFAVILSLIVEFFLAYIPFLGQHKTVHNLVYGAVTIIYIILDLDKKGVIELDRSVIIMPPTLELLGFAALCVISLWGSVFIAALIMSKLHKNTPIFFAIPVGITVIGCYYPVFVYGTWLGNKI